MMFGIMITKRNKKDFSDQCLWKTNLSHILNVQLAMMNKERMKTRRTVPGQMVIKVFKTNVVLNLIRLNAPILLDDASTRKKNNR